MNETGVNLLERWSAQRDAETFRAIVNRHGPMVYATCSRILRDRVQAEDITQECFETLASTRRPPREHLGAWLHRVATNLSLKCLRATGRRKARERQYAEIHGATTEPTWDDVYHYVDEAIARLPEKLRVPVVAHFLEGMTQQAIAERLSTSPSNVRYRIRQGLARIQAHLRKHRVFTGTGVLSALFASRLAEGAELPVALSENLGRLALAQTGNATGAVTGGIWANAVLWKSVLVAILPVAAVVTAFVQVDQTEAPPVPDEDAMVALHAPVSAESSETPQADGGETNSATEPAWPNALAPLSAGVPEEFQYLFQPLEQGLGVVAGTIVDPDGTPAAGARVTLFGMDTWWQHGYAETVTNTDGRYELRNLPMPRSFLLTAVSGKGFATGYVALYSYSFLEERLAQFGVRPMLAKEGSGRLGGGERIQRDLRLESFNANPITGRVFDDQRVPVEGAVVLTAGRPGLAQGLSMNVRTDREGRFALHHIVEPEATCSLVAYAEGFAPTMIHDVKSMSSENDIYMAPAVQVSGMAVRVDTGEPAANLDVTLRTVVDLDPSIVTSTNDMGEFVFKGLAPKVFMLSLVDLDKGLASSESPKLDLREGASVEGLLLPVSAGATISGRVYVEETNEPIEGIQVAIPHTRTDFPIREAVTGPDGVYTLRCLPSGKYAVQCDPPENVVRHFHYSDQGPPGPVQGVEIAPEEQREGIDFAFQGGVTVSGRVTDPDGNPIPGASLRAENSQQRQDEALRPGKGLPLQTSTVVTDQNGAYTLRGFAPPPEWTYTITVSTRGFAKLVSEPFEVTANMEGKDYSLQPAARISGYVVSLSGEPLPLVAVEVKPLDRNSGGSRTGAISDENGRFDFLEGVLPGEYYFEASGFINPNLDLPYNARTMNAPIVIEGTESVQGLRIVVPLRHECGTLSGIVVAGDTALLVEDAKVEVARVVSENGEDFGPSGNFEQKAGPGSFRLVGVYPGTVTLTAWAEGYPKQEVFTVDVQSGGELSDLRILLRTAGEVTAAVGGRVYTDGSVLQSKPQLYIRPIDPGIQQIQDLIREDGTYRVEGLAPGEYAVTVVIGDASSDGTMGWMRQETAFVDAEPGFEYTQDIELRGTCALRGRLALPPRAREARITVGVPDPDGRFSGWTHWPLDGPQEVIAAATRVTEAGEYLIRGIPPGAYTVTASCVVNQGTKAEQTLLVSERVALANGQEAVLDFSL